MLQDTHTTKVRNDFSMEKPVDQLSDQGKFQLSTVQTLNEKSMECFQEKLQIFLQEASSTANANDVGLNPKAALLLK